MSLAAEAKALARTQGGTCSIARLLVSVSDPTEYLEAFADLSIDAKALARALKARGHDVAEPAIRRHRRGDCKCL